MSYLQGDRSVFPGSEDSFTEAFDLSNAQVQQARRLQELKAKVGALTSSEQQEIIDIQSELRENTVTAEDWNKFGDAVVNLQRFFNDNVRGYIEQKQDEWDTYVNDFNYVGEFKVGINYKSQNMVTLPNGDLFIATNDHLSTLANGPIAGKSNTNWGLIGAKGDKGNDGLVGDFQGVWNSITNYTVGQAVVYVDQGRKGGLIYIANEANINKPPHSNPSDWTLITRLWTDTEEPLGGSPGMHFIRIVG